MQLSQQSESTSIAMDQPGWETGLEISSSVQKLDAHAALSPPPHPPPMSM